jgi:hypothetical protein
MIFGILCTSEHVAAQVDWFTSPIIHTQQLPWQLAFYIVDSDVNHADAIRLDLISESSTLFTPNPRLWSPNDLMYHLLPHLAALPAATSVVDLGCGSCRDLIYLAEDPNLLLNYVGIDHNKKGRSRALSFAARRGITRPFDFIAMNLRRIQCLDKWARMNGPISCIFGCRFLLRDLFTILPDLVILGGLVAWMHFVYPADGSKWRWEHPRKPSDILSVGELRARFESSSFEILCDTIVVDTDHGRPMQLFIAKKR